jgi:hypothetical protein
MGPHSTGAAIRHPLRANDQWEVTAAQRNLLANSLTERASRGDSFAADVALALSLLSTDVDAAPDDVARGMAAVGDTAWEADRTFESQGDRYRALLDEAGLFAAGAVTDAGQAILAAAALPEHPSLRELLRAGGPSPVP